MSSSSYGLVGPPIRGNAAGPSLIATGGATRDTGMSLVGSAAAMENEREMANARLEQEASAGNAQLGSTIGSVAGMVVGTAFGGPVGGAALSTLGGALGGVLGGQF